MPKPGKSAAGSDAKAGTLLPGSKKAATITGGPPPKVSTTKHGSSFISDAKKGR